MVALWGMSCAKEYTSVPHVQPQAVWQQTPPSVKTSVKTTQFDRHSNSGLGMAVSR